MKVSPRISINFNGQCAAAFKFYANCLGGKFERVFTWGDSPMAAHAPPEWAEKHLQGRAPTGEPVSTCYASRRKYSDALHCASRNP